MARISKLQQWLEDKNGTGNTAEEFLRQWNLGGKTRENLWKVIGYENEGACYNQARNEGILPGGPVSTGNNNEGGERKPRAGKCGVLPVKVALAVCKALGKDAEDYEEVDYNLYCTALGEQGDAWRDFLYTRLGGIESPAGQAFKAWCNFHVQAELEEQRRRERENDPTYQLKVRLANAQDATRIANNKIQALEMRISELEYDLRQIRADSRRTNGGTLTSEMKKLMIQRFHPDRMNGNNEEMYNSLTAWINALETVD